MEVVVKGVVLASLRRDILGMLFYAAILAVLVAATPPSAQVHMRHHTVSARHRARALHSRAVSAVALQRKVIRMTRLALLERQEALLRNFLIRAHTQTLLLRDDGVHEVAPGIAVSSSVVGLDLLGSPIIHARVTNARPAVATVVLIADVVDTRKTPGRASSALVLEPGETRVIELLCPTQLSPTSLRWSAMML